MKTIEEERTERLQRIEAVEKRHRNVVMKLGGVVVEREEPNTFSALVVSRSGDESVWLVSGTYEVGWGRVGVSGDYPRGPDRQYVDASYFDQTAGQWVKLESPRITVSLDKSDEKIAAEIERRFFPAYRARLKVVLEKVAAAAKAKTAREDNLTALKKAVTGSPVVTEYEKEQNSFGEYVGAEVENVGQTRIQVQVWQNSVNVDVSNLTRAEAIAVVAAVKAVAAKRKGGA